MSVPRHHAYLVRAAADVAAPVIDSILSAWETDRSTSEVLVRTVGLARVDDAVWLRQEASLSPSSGIRVVALCATTLPEELQNALLKTLEEPVQRVVIAICVPPGVRILPTILSRVAVIAGESSESVWNVDEFLRSSYADRFISIANWKKELEDDTDAFRTNAQALVSGIQARVVALAIQNPKLFSLHTDTFTDLDFVLAVLGERGASVGQMLDLVAMTVPEGGFVIE